jgi:hypothetical protein
MFVCRADGAVLIFGISEFVVGAEGIFGMLIMLAVMMPIVAYLPGKGAKMGLCHCVRRYRVQRWHMPQLYIRTCVCTSHASVAI